MTEFQKEVLRLLASIDKKITAQVVVTPVQFDNRQSIKEICNKENPYVIKV